MHLLKRYLKATAEGRFSVNNCLHFVLFLIESYRMMDKEDFGYSAQLHKFCFLVILELDSNSPHSHLAGYFWMNYYITRAVQKYSYSRSECVTPFLLIMDLIMNSLIYFLIMGAWRSPKLCPEEMVPKPCMKGSLSMIFFIVLCQTKNVSSFPVISIRLKGNDGMFPASAPLAESKKFTGSM